jgi:hypothetical protein
MSMSDKKLSEMGAEQAQNLMRHVDSTEALEAGIITPMAGTRPVRLFGIEEAETFLVVHDGATVAIGGAWATVNYVDPGQLSVWVGDVLGDAELSLALHDIAASRKPYGFLVPEMKALIASRIDQCNKALGLVEAAAN